MSDILRLNSKIKNKSIRLSDNNSQSTDSAFVDEDEIIRTNYQNYYDQGFSDGQRAVKVEYEHEFHSMLVQKFSEVASVIEKIEKALQDYDKSFDKLVIDLSIMIAEKILHKEIQLESPIITSIKAALQRVVGANNITIKLCPEDYKIITNNQKELFGDVSLSRIKFEPDDRIESGSCFIETEIGNVDGRTSTQLNELKKSLESSIHGF